MRASILVTLIFFARFSKGGQRELVTPLYWSDEDRQFYLYHARRISGEKRSFRWRRGRAFGAPT
ncbi:hypothetical protein DK37_30010 [Halomonas sp. SUBG004]|nr:hypothetical protein DK37_30010 [Halomonas sp. SUBG004]